MVAEWTDSLVAVSGTLSAVVITAMLRERNDKAHRAEDDRRAQEDNAVTMVATVSKALADHRRAMWTREANRHGAGGEAREQDVDRSHQTRSDVEFPLTELQIRVRSLRDVAQEAADATFEMHDSDDLEDLKARRRAAVAAAKAFKATAGAQFAEAGIGLEIGAATRTAPPSAWRRTLKGAIRIFSQEKHGMSRSPRRDPKART